ncbi:hypothetical protein SAMN04487919_13129 [Bacillus sp. ok061]|uniref:hypothetical protein n=1 Tax=Bacillus sp. ok061 TaxID=1761766 RepID=UPI00089EE436|nr:hypothetical protein [Bacillus sp. ok061]SEG81530.1 hypothetical protein SAMN04487919_13129 [Bacillus sp. ok061]
MKMVRRRAVIRLEKQRQSKNRFSAVKWEVHMNLGKRNYQTKYMLGSYQDMQSEMLGLTPFDLVKKNWNIN